MSTLQIFLFGKFHIHCGEYALAGLEASKVQELLCYLLLHRDRPHSRETLADLLWGDNLTVRSKKYLRQTLWRLQVAFEPYLKPSDGQLLLVERDWIQIDPAASLWVDVAEFEQAFALVQSMRYKAIDSYYVQVLVKAVDLYQGDLLEGWYQDWCLYERERLQNMYLAMLDKLMAYFEAHHKYEIGLSYGMRRLGYDRAHERTHQRLMRLYYLTGDRTAALRQYEHCVTALKEDLGVKPANRTRALLEQIAADGLDDSTLDAMFMSPNTLPYEVLNRLRQFQVTLANIQRQVEQDIQSIELGLFDQS